MLLIDSPIITLSRAEHPEKARVPIDVTEFPIVTFFKDEQFPKH